MHRILCLRCEYAEPLGNTGSLLQYHTVPVQTVIDTAKAVLYTGQIGDGKLFVYDIENVVKIRTGEEGFDALQDTQ